MSLSRDVASHLVSDAGKTRTMACRDDSRGTIKFAPSHPHPLPGQTLGDLAQVASSFVVASPSPSAASPALPKPSIKPTTIQSLHYLEENDTHLSTPKYRKRARVATLDQIPQHTTMPKRRCPAPSTDTTEPPVSLEAYATVFAQNAKILLDQLNTCRMAQSAYLSNMVNPATRQDILPYLTMSEQLERLLLLKVEQGTRNLFDAIEKANKPT